MTSPEALRRAVDEAPPVAVDDVLERARQRERRRRRSRAALAVVVGTAVVAAIATRIAEPVDHDDEVVAAGNDDGDIALAVEVSSEGLGPIATTVGAIRDLGPGTGPHDPDQVHTLLLTNTSDSRVYLEDHRLAWFVGDPPALFAAGHGCGPPGACTLEYRPMMIDPGRTLELDINLFHDDAYADFTEGTAELLVEWRDDRPFDLDRRDEDADAIHAGTVELRYCATSADRRACGS